MGVIEAGEEKGVFIIGDSSPHNEISPAVVLADTMTQFGPAMYSVVSEFANGSFSPAPTSPRWRRRHRHHREPAHLRAPQRGGQVRL